MSEIRDIEVTIEGHTEIIRGQKRKDKIYYCLESLLFIPKELYGCEIEVNDEGSQLKYIGIHRESEFTTHRFLWSKEFIDSVKGRDIKEKITDSGGDWEQVMGGMFFIHLPKEKSSLLNEILQTAE